MHCRGPSICISDRSRFGKTLNGPPGFLIFVVLGFALDSRYFAALVRIRVWKHKPGIQADFSIQPSVSMRWIFQVIFLKHQNIADKAFGSVGRIWKLFLPCIKAAALNPHCFAEQLHHRLPPRRGLWWIPSWATTRHSRASWRGNSMTHQRLWTTSARRRFFVWSLCHCLDECRTTYTANDNQYANTYELPRELMRVRQLFSLKLPAGCTFTGCRLRSSTHATQDFISALLGEVCKR